MIARLTTVDGVLELSDDGHWLAVDPEMEPFAKLLNANPLYSPLLDYSPADGAFGVAKAHAAAKYLQAKIEVPNDVANPPAAGDTIY